MNDRCIVAITEDGLLRARASRLARSVEACLIRALPGVQESLLLARGLALVSVYPTSWKADDRVALRWQGDGAVPTLICQMARPGTLRAAVAARRWPLEEGRDAGIAGVLGEGLLSVIVERQLKVHARSEIALDSGDLDSDLRHYFELSVQTPTRLASAARISPNGLEAAAGAVLVQSLPGAGEAELPPQELFALDPEADASDHLARVFQDRPYRILEEFPLSFHCPCSRERIASGLQLLNTEELRQMIEEDDGAKARCEFCKDLYSFSAAELQAILDRRDLDAS